jgi:hypothetical protein
MNIELENYVKSAKAKGQSDEQITSDIKKNGWNDQDIAEVLYPVSVSTHSTPKTFKYKILLFVFIPTLILGGGVAYAYLTPNSFLGKIMNKSFSNTLNTNNELNLEEPNNFSEKVTPAAVAETNYTHLSGLFSLNIPPSWMKSYENNESVSFLTEQGQKSMRENGNLYINFANINGASSKNTILISSKISNENNVKIGKYVAERFDFQGDEISRYNIPILYNEKSFIISVSFEALHFPQEKELIENVIKNIVIHDDKIPAVMAALDPQITIPEKVEVTDTIKKGDIYITKYVDPSGILSIYRPAGWFNGGLGSQLPLLFDFRMGDTGGSVGTLKIYLASPGDASPTELKLTDYTLSSQNTLKISGIDSKKYFYTLKKPGNEYVKKTTVYEIPITSKNKSIIVVSNLNDPDRINEVDQALQTIIIDISKIK